ncbi:hemagglutinin [Rathayibacter festucae]|uniref:Hemagglutinin n=1 Tax=Rathayibacter festucae DSM 15932 TaxID=1328866 RepID=A0A3Q9UWW9_9MICO|nr:hemagglutinin [Rathayibacter festucae]AZZ51095.1 hemagglutinin [Rathayibacter festucae DSM 15932]
MSPADPSPAAASPSAVRRRRGGTAALAALAVVLLLTGASDLSAAAAPATEVPGIRMWTDLAGGVDESGFDPGDIVSDEVFFDGGALGPLTVQAFLNARVPSCAGTDVPCLRDYAEDTGDVAADEQCDAYLGGQDVSAAEIVSAVAGACDVSPAVLLTLLQKEQSLVTDSAPSERQFRSATGYGCPDTADCDSDYFGFFGQVYGAAWQFQRYRNPDSSFDWYPVGETSEIQYSPDAACGTAPVRIENAATAGLYYYTPYQPNAAALANLYGSGDACSAYGNRNFWRIFSNWFGDPRAGE